ncbi:MAG TPA: dTDP-glucose 4,6-dehydratase [Flavobacteriales bacterium]|jgi:dTDP-glucose 4,6-dehydratase|nr:dTDP-glucose 4,6-dehydratase [Flavobacteriales bacterium]
MSTKTILITGGAGFIGSHVVRRFVVQYPDYNIVNLDVLTYAGNLENLRDIEGKPNYTFIKADIRNQSEIVKILHEYRISDIIHLAAESHVDRSIANPNAFVETNVMGTVFLMNAFKDLKTSGVFFHISTDEVYGSLGETGYFTESTAYDPRSPYSASKASSDHFVRAYGNSYGLNFLISNCSNNYGPNQFPEKLIPLVINNIQYRKALPIYGDGQYTRDWLYVEDHAEAIDVIFHKGKHGETYNIGGDNELKNIELVRAICAEMDVRLSREKGSSEELITYVKDRPGHDRRYAIDSSKLKNELGWKPQHDFSEGIKLTIDWYLENSRWLAHVTSGEYQTYYEEQYLKR